MAFIPKLLSNLFTSSAIGALNDNFTNIRNEFLAMLRRDGSTTMLGDLDMDSHRVINVGFPRDGNDLVRLIDIPLITKGEKGDKGENGEGVDVLDSVRTALLPVGSVTIARLQAALSSRNVLSSVILSLPALVGDGGVVNEATRLWQSGGTTFPDDALGQFIVATLGYTPAQRDALYADAGVADAAALPIPELVARFPVNAYSPLKQVATDVTAAIFVNFWDSTNNHLKPTDGSGNQNNGLVVSSGKPSIWQMCQLFGPLIYDRWKNALSTGDSVTAADCVTKATGQWTYVQSVFTLSELRTGNGGIVNISDDASWYADFLKQIHEMTGSATALACFIEFLPYIANRFHDPLATGGDYIDYQVSSPILGTPFKCDRLGMLYAAASDTNSIRSYGYVSTSYEAVIADAAAYFSQVNAVPSAFRTAFLAYAKNTYSWIFSYLRTPNPTSVGRTAQGVYYVALNRDPNVNAANNTGVNGGAAFTGTYDTNQTYLQAQNAYFGAPIRSLTSSGEISTIAMGALSARLSVITADSTYTAEAVNISNVFALTTAFGRIKDGLPYLGNLRDPWTNYRKLPDFWRLASGFVGFDDSGKFQAALINSSRKALLSSFDGYLSANLSGEERNFLDNSYNWEDTASVQGLGGGGQAHAKQIMTTGTTLSVIVTALQITDSRSLLSSGVSSQAALEMIPSLMSSLRMANEESFPRAGGIANGRIGVKDSQFYLDLNANGDPYINFNTGSTITFPRDPSKAAFILTINHVDVMSIDGNGVLTVKGPVVENGVPQ